MKRRSIRDGSRNLFLFSDLLDVTRATGANNNSPMTLISLVSIMVWKLGASADTSHLVAKNGVREQRLSTVNECNRYL
jgi:hypothetical protein